MNDTDYLIRVEKVTKVFDRPTGGPLNVLDGASLTISPGDALALMGPNGSGKTTLLRIIAGELAPTSGRVYLLGRDATKMPAHRRARSIGRVHQESYKSLASELTVEETLALAARRGAPLSLGFTNAQHVFEAIRGFPKSAADFVEPRRNMASRTLSGGQRQLLALIIAILGQPRVLLLDEHQASLDEEFKEIANELVHGFVARNGRAFVAVTHDRSWVEGHALRVVRLSGGIVTAGLETH